MTYAQGLCAMFVCVSLHATFLRCIVTLTTLRFALGFNEILVSFTVPSIGSHMLQGTKGQTHCSLSPRSHPAHYTCRSHGVHYTCYHYTSRHMSYVTIIYDTSCDLLSAHNNYDKSKLKLHVWIYSKANVRQ